VSRRSPIPGDLKGELGAQLARLGGSQGAPLDGIVAAWAGAVGPAIAANAWPARSARDGTLIVHTSSSVWSHELTQLEAELRDRLGEAAPERMRFVVGPVPETDRSVVADVEQTIASATDAELGAAAEIAQGIEDPELRGRVEAAAARSLAAARSRGPNRPV
jgi:hypothetical protein